MNIIDYFVSQSPITNLNDFLNLSHSNPLGISPLIQLIIIFVLVEVMEFFNSRIRHAGQVQYYPIIYVLFFLSLLAMRYYCFQDGLPKIEIWNEMTGDPVMRNNIGWFCDHKEVGWGWAIFGVLATIHVVYCMLCALLQIMMNISKRAGIKHYHEWRYGTGLWIFGIIIYGIFNLMLYNYVVAAWIIVFYILAVIAFSIYKFVADVKQAHQPWWSLLMGVIFFWSMTITMMMAIECMRAAVVALVAILAIFIRAKAKKYKAPGAEKSAETELAERRQQQKAAEKTLEV